MEENYITYEQFKTTPSYEKFLAENPSQGVLKVQAFTSDQAIPIADAEVYIVKKIDGQDVLFFKGTTNSSGIIDNIVLPAPDGDYNFETLETPKYTTYELVFSSKLYNTIQQYQIAMFGGIKVLQYIKLKMDGNGGKM